MREFHAESVRVDMSAFGVGSYWTSQNAAQICRVSIVVIALLKLSGLRVHQ